jgi:hypothetical protein
MKIILAIKNFKAFPTKFSLKIPNLNSIFNSKNPRVKLEIKFPIIVKENAEKSISIQFYFPFNNDYF